jgi:hypothetical protein
VRRFLKKGRPRTFAIADNAKLVTGEHFSIRLKRISYMRDLRDEWTAVPLYDSLWVLLETRGEPYRRVGQLQVRQR